MRIPSLSQIAPYVNKNSNLPKLINGEIEFTLISPRNDVLVCDNNIGYRA